MPSGCLGQPRMAIFFLLGSRAHGGPVERDDKGLGGLVRLGLTMLMDRIIGSEILRRAGVAHFSPRDGVKHVRRNFQRFHQAVRWTPFRSEAFRLS